MHGWSGFPEADGIGGGSSTADHPGASIDPVDSWATDPTGAFPEGQPSSSRATSTSAPTPAAASEVTWRDLSWEELVDEATRLGPDDRFARLTDDVVLELVTVGAAQLEAAMCRWLELLAELVVRGVWARQGARTPGAWLSWRLGVAPSTAREQVRVALQLREFPATRERLAAGELSYSKVRAITRCGHPDIEPMLLTWADSATAGQMEEIARGFRSTERNRRTEVEEEPDAAGCSVRSRVRPRGRRALTIVGPDDVIVALEDDLRRVAEQLVADRENGDDQADDATSDDHPPAIDAGEVETAGGPGTDPEGQADDLPAAPARAKPTATDQVDALATVLAGAASDGPADTSGLDRHTLVLTASVHDLPDLGDHVSGPPDDDRATGAVGGGSASAEAVERRRDVVPVADDHGRVRGMDRQVLRRLACEAGIVLVATDERGSPLDVGRRDRRTTAALRRALRSRDQRCTFPGCGASRHLHAHHVVHWADRGPTNLSNLVLVCGPHHRFIHAENWSIEVRADGRHRFTAPRASRPAPVAGALPGASAEAVEAHAPPSATATSLRPPWHDGVPYDLDTAIAVLVERHPAAGDRVPIAV